MTDIRYTPGHTVARLGVFLLPILPLCFTEGWADHHDNMLGWDGVAAAWLLALLVHLGLVAGHELAHCLAARAVGIQVIEITIGHWRRLCSCRLGSINVVIRVLPDSGYVLTRPTPELGSRWRAIPFLAAGVIFESLAVAIANITLGTLPASVATFSEYLSAFLLWCVIVFGIAHIGINLWPWNAETGGRQLPTDGKQIIDALRGNLVDPTKIAEGLNQERVLNELIARKDYRGAIDLLEPIYREQPRRVPIACLLANLLARNQEHDRAISVLRTTLDYAGLTDAEKAQLLDTLACVPLYYGIADRLGEAEAWIRTAVTYSPHAITLRGTLGAILVEQGRIDEAEPILKAVLRKSEDPIDHAISRACLAKIALKRGNVVSARTLVAAAAAQSPLPELVVRIAREIECDASPTEV